MMLHFLQSKKQYILDYDNLIRLFYLPFILAMKKSCKNAMLCLWCGGALQIIMTACFLILWYSCFEDSRTTLDNKTNMNLKWIFNIFQPMGVSYKENNWLRRISYLYSYWILFNWGLWRLKWLYNMKTERFRAVFKLFVSIKNLKTWSGRYNCQISDDSMCRKICFMIFAYHST